MKKYLIPLLGALLFGGVSAAAQDDPVKTGWSCIPVPDVSYSTDIGWNFGAFGDLFYYGDGSTSSPWPAPAPPAAPGISTGCSTPKRSFPGGVSPRP